jgi:hypothetical protein
MVVPVKGGRPSAGILSYNENSVEHSVSSWTTGRTRIVGVLEERAEETMWTEEGSEQRVEKSAWRTPSHFAFFTKYYCKHNMEDLMDSACEKRGKCI